MKLQSLFAGAAGGFGQRMLVQKFGSKLPFTGYGRQAAEGVLGVLVGMGIERFGGGSSALRALGQGMAVTSLAVTATGMVTRSRLLAGEEV